MCVFLLRIVFRLIATSQAHLSRSLSLSRGSLPSLLPCAAAAAIGGRWQVRRILYLCWCGFSSAQEYRLLPVCVFLSSHSSFYEEESLFVFLVFFSSCFFFFFFFFTGGEDLLFLCVCVCVCVCLREKGLFVCLFFFFWWVS